MYGSPSLRRLSLLAIMAVLGFLLPLWLPAYFLYIGNYLMTFAVLAIGLDLLLGWAGQFAFAHIAFFGVGAYGTVLLQTRFGLPFVLAMPVSAVVAAVIGMLLAFPAAKLRAVYLALATFAFAEGAQWVFNSWDSVTGGADGLRIKAPVVFGHAMGTDAGAFPVVTIVLVLILAATLYLTTSKLGRSLCAIRDSEHAATASGIDVRATKIIVFAISAAYAGIAGGLFTTYQSFMNPESFGFTQIVLVLSMIVVGGLGTLPGTLIGVVLLGILPELMRTAMRSLLLWQEMVYGFILILAMMYMPRGIWGTFFAGKEKRA